MQTLEKLSDGHHDDTASIHFLDEIFVALDVIVAANDAFGSSDEGGFENGVVSGVATKLKFPGDDDDVRPFHDERYVRSNLFDTEFVLLDNSRAGQHIDELVNWRRAEYWCDAAVSEAFNTCAG